MNLKLAGQEVVPLVGRLVRVTEQTNTHGHKRPAHIYTGTLTTSGEPDGPLIGPALPAEEARRAVNVTR